MKISELPWQRLLQAAAVAGRWLLGAAFIKMGMHKALHPVEFLKLMRQYEMVTNPLVLNFIAVSLGWFEAFCGLLLLAGIAVRGTALAVLAMLIPFTLVVARRAMHLANAKALAFCAVKFDCGCGNGPEFICHKLLENFLFMLLAAWLIAGAGRPLSARFSLVKPAPS